MATRFLALLRGINVGGNSFQKMGAVRDYFALRGTPLTTADAGRFNVTHREADRHFFKVPTLRQVAETGPWFHDGHATTLEDAVRRLRGEPQTKVTVWVTRDSEATPKAFELTREIIKVKSVEFRALDNGIGYIRLKQFQQSSNDELSFALDVSEDEALDRVQNTLA